MSNRVYGSWPEHHGRKPANNMYTTYLRKLARRKIIHPVAKDRKPVDANTFLYKCPECGKKVANKIIICIDCLRKLQVRK